MNRGLRGARAMRMVLREATELTLARGGRWQEATAPDRLDCLILQVVLSANLAGVPLRVSDSGTWIDAPDAVKRPLSAMALSRSMNLSYETVRRRATALIQAGSIVQGKDGMVVPATLFAEPGMAAAVREDAAAYVRSLTRLAEQRHALSAEAIAGDIASLPAPAIGRLLLDYVIRILGGFTALHGDVINGTIHAAVVNANVAHIQADPVLSQRYAGEDQVPPDEERRPVPMRQLARAIDLPFEGTWSSPA